LAFCVGKLDQQAITTDKITPNRIENTKQISMDPRLNCSRKTLCNGELVKLTKYAHGVNFIIARFSAQWSIAKYILGKNFHGLY